MTNDKTSTNALVVNQTENIYGLLSIEKEHQRIAKILHQEKRYPGFMYVDILIEGMVSIHVKGKDVSEYIDISVGEYGVITKDFDNARTPKWKHYFKAQNGWVLSDESVSVSWEDAGPISLTVMKHTTRG
jgi:hypothetical protein